MRYSSIRSVEYDLKLHHKLLDNYSAKISELSEYNGYRLKPTSKKGLTQFYSAKRPGETKYHYVGSGDNEQVQLIRENAFYAKAIEVIRDNISIMEDFLRIYRRTNAANINELLASSYRLGPRSVLLRDEKEIDEWVHRQKERKGRYPVFDPAGLKVDAFDGTPMRSRAEGLHYEAFYIYNIPVIFELPYEINGEVYRPDFTFLDVFTMSDKMLEHLGNWFHTNEFKRNSYRSDAIHRIDEYATIGFYPEVDLILTFGSQDNIFDIQSLHRKIAAFASPPPSEETMEMLKRM